MNGLKRWAFNCPSCGFSWFIVTRSTHNGEQAMKAAERRHRRQCKERP